MALEYREVLRQQGRLDVGRLQDLADRRRTAIGRQDLQRPDSGGMRERLEQVRLDLLERPLGAVGKALRHGEPPSG